MFRTEISPPFSVLPVPSDGTTSLNLGHPEFIRGGFFLGTQSRLFCGYQRFVTACLIG
jgi:hypothetical protein